MKPKLKGPWSLLDYCRQLSSLRYFIYVAAEMPRVRLPLTSVVSLSFGEKYNCHVVLNAASWWRDGSQDESRRVKREKILPFTHTHTYASLSLSSLLLLSYSPLTVYLHPLVVFTKAVTSWIPLKGLDLRNPVSHGAVRDSGFKGHNSKLYLIINCIWCHVLNKKICMWSP